MPLRFIVQTTPNPVIWNTGLSSPNISITNNDLTVQALTTDETRSAVATFSQSSGAWYCEFQVTGGSNYPNQDRWGIYDRDSAYDPLIHSPGYSESWGLRYYNNNTMWSWHNGVQITNYSASSGVLLNDVLMMAFDIDNGKLWLGKNDNWYGAGDPATGTNALITDATIIGKNIGICINPYTTTKGTYTAHFSSGDLVYSPPSGFSVVSN